MGSEERKDDFTEICDDYPQGTDNIKDLCEIISRVSVTMWEGSKIPYVGIQSEGKIVTVNNFKKNLQ